MVGVLVVVAVWSLCLVAILRLHYEVTRTRLPSPDKWEPGFLLAPTHRSCIHVEVLPGHESEAAEEVLRADLDLAREGL